MPGGEATYLPGDHGRGRVKESEYNLQLREQARRIYGVLEKQFHNYYVEAAGRASPARCCSSCWRHGWTTWSTGAGWPAPATRRGSWSGIRIVTVNGRKVNIPSYQVKPGDVVQVKERMRQNLNVHESIQLQTGRPQLGWLEPNAGEAKLTVTAVPSREQVEVPIQEQLIVELYSK